MRFDPSRRATLVLVLALAPSAPFAQERTDAVPRYLSTYRLVTVEDGASGVTGVRGAGTVAADAAITARVKAALLADDDIAGMKIDVGTSSGVVTLAGSVASVEQSQRAVAMARRVDGVVDVVSRLTVGP